MESAHQPKKSGTTELPNQTKLILKNDFVCVCCTQGLISTMATQHLPWIPLHGHAITPQNCVQFTATNGQSLFCLVPLCLKKYM